MPDSTPSPAAEACDAPAAPGCLKSPGQVSTPVWPGHVPRKARAISSTIWWTTWLIWIPQTAIWYVVASVYPGHTPHDIFVTPALALIFGCALGPYLETQFMRLGLHVLHKCLGDNPRVLWYSAIFWGVMHIPSSTWGLHAVWGFYMFSRFYLAQAKFSIRRAVWMTTAVHAGCNLLSYTGNLLWESME